MDSARKGLHASRMMSALAMAVRLSLGVKRTRSLSAGWSVAWRRSAEALVLVLTMKVRTGGLGMLRVASRRPFRMAEPMLPGFGWVSGVFDMGWGVLGYGEEIPQPMKARVAFVVVVVVMVVVDDIEYGLAII